MKEGEAALIRSELLRPRDAVCVKFWYNMYGYGMGKLEMGTITDLDRSTFQVKWSQEGNQGATWKEATVNVKLQQSAFYVRYLLYYYSTHARTNKCNLFVLYNKNFNGLRSCEIFSAQKTSPLMWSDVDLTSSVRVSSIRSVNNQCKCAQQSHYTHMAVTLGTSSLAIYLLMKMFLLIVNVSSLIALFAQDKFSF